MLLTRLELHESVLHCPKQVALGKVVERISGEEHPPNGTPKLTGNGSLGMDYNSTQNVLL